MSDGRPAGRAGAGVFDNGVAAHGHPWTYDGEPGEAVHDGPLGADRTVVPDRASEPAPYEHRELAAVRIRCFRHEGIVVDHQRVHGLRRLTGTWELSLADGRVLTGPAVLPDLRPGETAAVPLPFALPEDGGEAWLTLRVTTAEDEPRVPRGTQVCAPKVRLRAAAVPAPRPAVTGRPVGVDEPRLVSVPLPRPTAAGTPLRAEDLTAAAHHDEPASHPGRMVRLDTALRGPGTASRRSGTATPSHLVPARLRHGI